MFVLSVKSSKMKLFLLISFVILLAVSMIAVTLHGGKPTSNTANINFKAANAEQRVAFLSQFGWNVTEDPIEVAEVLIPETFDDVYEKYNVIQKEQELDLTPYRGKRVKRWTYEILNYPGYDSDCKCIRANLLVYDGLVIGGDVCSVELDGFMHGFDRPDKGESKNGTAAAR